MQPTLVAFSSGVFRSKRMSMKYLIFFACNVFVIQFLQSKLKNSLQKVNVIYGVKCKKRLFPSHSSHDNIGRMVAS